MGTCFAGVPSKLALPLMLPPLGPPRVIVEAARTTSPAANAAFVRMIFTPF